MCLLKITNCVESWVIYDPQGFLDKDGKVIEIIVTLSLISMLHRKVINLKAVLTAAVEKSSLHYISCSDAECKYSFF